MTQGADYSAGRPTGAALKAAQFAFVIRYIGLGSSGKRLTAAEYRDLTAAGVTVLLVAELGTGDSWGTSSDDDYGRGRANAAVALADARACGVPEDKIFVFAPSDAHAAAQWQINDTVAYVRGFRDVLGINRTGHYGFSETNVAVHNAGVASGFWRCGSQPSTADKTWVNFWQRNAAPTMRVVSGVACDINELYRPISNLSPGGFMSGFNGDDFNALMWGNVFDVNGNRNYAAFVKDMDAKLGGLVASLAAVTKLITDGATHPVDAEQLAAALEGKLIADLIPAVTQAVTQASGAEAADQVRKMLVAKLGA